MFDKINVFKRNGALHSSKQIRLVNIFANFIACTYFIDKFSMQKINGLKVKR
jgi:hypothetical protein